MIKIEHVGELGQPKLGAVGSFLATRQHLISALSSQNAAEVHKWPWMLLQ
jgi:hypothetical protein